MQFRFYRRIPFAAGEKVQLIGFGNFEVRERCSSGRNPQTGESYLNRSF